MNRVAIVAGLRTPFAKAGTGLKDFNSVELGALLVRELVARAELDPKEIDQIVFGQVVPSPLATIVGREVGLRAGLPKNIEAHTVSCACATGIRAIASAQNSILTGNANVAIAGGTESLSDFPLFASQGLSRAILTAAKRRSWLQKLAIFSRLKLKDLAPAPPILKEPSTGLSMGESAEKMAKENGIGREEQDRFALESQHKAAAAINAGKFDAEIIPVKTENGAIAKDNLVRSDPDLAALGALRPVFDRKSGTITAGNSSPLTDGAAAVLLMPEDRARALGKKPLGYIRSVAFAGLDPADQLLMGPAYAVPIALERAGLALGQMDLIEVHEAFAAQALSNIQAMASNSWAKEKLGKEKAVGEIDLSKLNVNGGAIALGHPFAASGARMVTTALNELARRSGQFALITLCAAGGLGTAMVLERE